ncbi:hypothetical protein M569_08162 [Genlisea aurea]|uniref:Uncharacterized protein n=1 Tax=Genlisea aurea TaxID=192259 RepID=S8CIQ6_9LAMI|nr:hypothetical protein M569_08162 [Genlisea aurea]
MLRVVKSEADAPDSKPVTRIVVDDVIVHLNHEKESVASEIDRKETESRLGDTDNFLSEENVIMNMADGARTIDSISPQVHCSHEVPSGRTSSSNSQVIMNKDLSSHDDVKNEKELDDDGDAWNFSFFKPIKQPQPLSKNPGISSVKRQVIQLNLPVQSKPGSKRLSSDVKRFQSPKLDDWYKPILELDFFETVGLAHQTDNDHETSRKLKEVPICFDSPQQYIEIFRALALEEFKAQLKSSYQEMVHGEEMSCGSLSVLFLEKTFDFHIVRFAQDENESAGSKNLSENDLILLTRQPVRGHASGDIHTMGKVRQDL